MRLTAIKTRLQALLASLPGMLYCFANQRLWRMNFVCWRPLEIAARQYRAVLARRMRVVAVVGSYGKTTTTRALKVALGMPLSAWTDLNANCGALVPLALLRHFPPSRFAVIEVGISRPHQMRRYAASLMPNIVVVNAIGREHIQSFRDLAHLRDEEAHMVRMLRPDGLAVLNGDDDNVRWMATQTDARVVTYGLHPDNEVYASDLALEWPYGTRFLLHAHGQSQGIQSQLIGTFMLYPLLAAAAVALTEGRPLSEVGAMLASLPPTPGRLQPVLLPGGATVLRDDYKSTIDTVYAALDILEQIPARRRIIVLGDLDAPPPPERPHYRAVGRRVAQVADEAIFVGVKFASYRAGARFGGMGDDGMKHAASIHSAIGMLQGKVGPGDVLLVKGREGQRLTRIILALQGRAVRCTVDPCRLHLRFCDNCPLLGPSHGGVPSDV